MAKTSVRGMRRDAVEPAVLAAEVGDVSHQMRAEYARPDLRPSRALQQADDDDQADEAAEEKDLEGRELRRELATRYRHRHEGDERTGHPERSAERGREGSQGHLRQVSYGFGREAYAAKCAEDNYRARQCPFTE